jgi:hypothetical protein
VDEANCNWEKVTLCAFQQADQKTQVSFLACMDDSSKSDPVEAAEGCANGLDMDKIKTCYSGSESQSLLEDASAKFNKALPGSTTIPHTFVNAEDVSPSYQKLKSALCSAGSAAPVCAEFAEAAKCIV